MGKLHPVEFTNPAKGLLVTPPEGCSVCAAELYKALMCKVLYPVAIKQPFPSRSRKKELRPVKGTRAVGKQIYDQGAKWWVYIVISLIPCTILLLIYDGIELFGPIFLFHSWSKTLVTIWKMNRYISWVQSCLLLVCGFHHSFILVKIVPGKIH